MLLVGNTDPTSGGAHDLTKTLTYLSERFPLSLFTIHLAEIRHHGRFFFVLTLVEMHAHLQSMMSIHNNELFIVDIQMLMNYIC